MKTLPKKYPRLTLLPTLHASMKLISYLITHSKKIRLLWYVLSWCQNNTRDLWECHFILISLHPKSISLQQTSANISLGNIPNIFLCLEHKKIYLLFLENNNDTSYLIYFGRQKRLVSIKEIIFSLIFHEHALAKLLSPKCLLNVFNKTTSNYIWRSTCVPNLDLLY